MRYDVKIDRLVLLSVILCAVVLFGEFTAYGPNPHNYSSDLTMGDGGAVVTVSSSGSDTYTAIFMDSGSYSPPARLYILSDERYDSSFNDADKIVGLKRFDLLHAIDQVSRSLKVRGFEDIVICNDEQLFTSMTEDLGSDIPKGLLVMTYALPESIYSGRPGDLIFDWIAKGNSLYWMDSPIGKLYRSGDEIVSVDNYQQLFFGKECVNESGVNLALSAIDGDGLTTALALKWNRTLFGLDTSGIDDAVSIGFYQDGFSSVSMVPFGKGMICVVGGTYDRYQCDDVSQLISSGVSCYTIVLKIESGKVKRDTVEIVFKVPDNTKFLRVYVSIGGYYTVYGGAFNVR